jgi:hypothetical protein
LEVIDMILEAATGDRFRQYRPSGGGRGTG